MTSLARCLALAITLAFAAAACAQPTPAHPPPLEVTTEKDITYGKAGDEELKLNLARPTKPAEDGKPRPALVVIHGGGWRGGHRNDMNLIAINAAQRGYVAVTISYRLCPRHVFPAQVEDAKCAVRFLRAHAKEYGLDPDRIGATGASAGAHLAMMLATAGPDDGLEGEGGWKEQSSKVKAAVSFVGPTDLTANDLPTASRNIVKDFLGGPIDEKKDAARKASPLTYVNKGDAPMLLFQGTVDPLIPNTQAYRMAEAMSKAGVKGRVELIVGGGHGWGGREFARTLDEMFKFLGEHLND